MFDPQKDLEASAERILAAVVNAAIEKSSGYKVTFHLSVEVEKKSDDRNVKDSSGSPR